MNRSKHSHSRTTSRIRHLRTPSLLVGLIVLGGCGSTSSIHNVEKTGVGLDRDARDVASLRAYMYDTSSTRELPEAYLSEGRIGLSDVEYTLAAARATEVEHAATLMDRYAALDSDRQDVSSLERSTLADAEFRRRQFDAEVNAMFAQVTARRREIEASNMRNSSYVDALIKERSSQSDDMASEAEREYNRSLARLENLRDVRNATEQEGLVVINSMTDRVQISRARVIAVAEDLRRQAQTAQEQSDAHASEYRASIISIEGGSEAQSALLRAEGRSTLKQANASAYELRAQAKSREASSSDEQHGLRLASIKTGWDQSQAEHDQALSDAQTALDRAFAEGQRLRSNAKSLVGGGRSSFERNDASAYKMFKNTTADANQMFTSANRAETNARMSFVKAEAAAGIKAAQSKAAHQNALAEAEVNEITAAAEAEATRVHAAILQEFAKQQKNGNVTSDEAATDSRVSIEELHTVPASAKVAKKSARIEPNHVASYRIALAQVMRDRVKAQTLLDVAKAAYEERTVALEADLHMALVTSAEQMNLARTRESQADSEFAAARERISAQLAEAESEYRHRIAIAESFRKDSITTATELYAEAEAVERTGDATHRRLWTEADVVDNEASESIRVVRAKLKATNQRGAARHALLLTEAESAELSAGALATEMEAQIVSARQTLEAELAQLDQRVESSVVIAQANYSEAQVYVEAFVRNTEFEIVRIRSQNELDYDLAWRDVELDRDRTYTTVLRGEAEVERLVASAHAQSDRDNAFLDAGYTAAHSSAQIARADVESQREIARAKRDSVVSRFGSRLVQVDADRIRNTVSSYRIETSRRVSYEKALAEAEAAQVASQDRLARLNQQQRTTQEIAVDNWNARLANVRYKTDVNSSETWTQPSEYSGSSLIADVPTDGDW